MFISLRGGVFNYRGKQLGRKVTTIILDYAYERAYYSDPYVPGKQVNPACTALKRIQSQEWTPTSRSSCVNCGSKSWCKEQRRLLVLVDGIDEPVRVKVPPSSVLEFDEYTTKTLLRGRPLWSVYTEIKVKNPPFFRLFFKKVDEVDPNIEYDVEGTILNEEVEKTIQP